MFLNRSILPVTLNVSNRLFNELLSALGSHLLGRYNGRLSYAVLLLFTLNRLSSMPTDHRGFRCFLLLHAT